MFPGIGRPILFVNTMMFDPCEITSEGQKRMIKPVIRVVLVPAVGWLVFMIVRLADLLSFLELEPWDN